MVPHWLHGGGVKWSPIGWLVAVPDERWCGIGWRGGGKGSRPMACRVYRLLALSSANGVRMSECRGALLEFTHQNGRPGQKPHHRRGSSHQGPQSGGAEGGTGAPGPLQVRQQEGVGGTFTECECLHGGGWLVGRCSSRNLYVLLAVVAAVILSLLPLQYLTLPPHHI